MFSLAANFSTLQVPRFISTRPFASYPNHAEDYQKFLNLKTDSDLMKLTAVHDKFRFHLPAAFPPPSKVSFKYLQSLVNAVQKSVKFPVINLCEPPSTESNHFFQNKTFINLPYAQRTSVWPDRSALTTFIETHFQRIFRKDDLVVVPGCADGQIPIEIFGNSLRYSIPIDIIACDFNQDAMCLGQLTMEAYDLNSRKIVWVRGDATKSRLQHWIKENMRVIKTQRVVTLIQPSLSEENFLKFLENVASNTDVKIKTLIMPILILDPSSLWYNKCQMYIDLSANSKRSYFWRDTQYGREMLLGWNDSREPPVIEQYFIKESAVQELRKKYRFEDVTGPFQPLDRLFEGVSRRHFCIWEHRSEE